MGAHSQMNGHRSAALEYFVQKIDPKNRFCYVDVGAMGGVPRKWDPLKDMMKVVAFEPDPREFQLLKNSDLRTYLNCILYQESRDLPFYISRASGKSSVYKPNQDLLSQFMDAQRFDVVDEKRFHSDRVKSLDAVLAENGIADIDFIKLDTQGSELPILEGGQKKALPKIFGIHLEVEFLQLYEGQPLFGDIDQFLNKNGFQLMDLRRAYWKRKDYYDYIGKGQLIFGDALYFKGIDAVMEALKKEDRADARTKIYKCMLCCLVFKMFDYAVLLANRGLTQQYFSPSERDEAAAMIKACAREGRLPNFLGKTFLYRVFNKLSEKLQPASHLGWADGDRFIGNIKDI